MGTDYPISAERKILASAMLLFPSLFILVFIMHFRRLGDFFKFRTHYAPAPPQRVVERLIAARNQWPLFHDPHMLGYLSLPVIVLCAFALYVLGREKRPLASGVALMTTVSGTIYLGGVFGMWTAFYRGLGLVDPAYTEGATATFAAMTTPQGAFLVTTTLAKLAMIGFAAQALVLIGTRVPLWAIVSVVAGCVLFLLFWDLDNWMLIGTVFMMIGFWRMRGELVRV